MALTFTFGKARVRVSVEGCVSCGTRWSWHWVAEKQVAVQVGKRAATVDLYRCGDCSLQGEQLRLEGL